MPKVKISDFSTTANNNTDINSINIAEGCAPSGINDAIRTLMAQLKDWQSGAVAQDNTFNGVVGALAQNPVRMYDTDSSNYVALRAPGTVSSNVTWTLPGTDGTANQVLKTDGAGVLGWVTAASGDVTTTGTQTLTNKTLDKPKLISYSEEVFVGGNVSGAVSVDLSAANIFTYTLTGTTTFTFTNPPSSNISKPATLIIKQDATGSRTASFTSAKWTDSVSPTLTTTANRTDVFTFFTVDGGTSYFGTYAMANVA